MSILDQTKGSKKGVSPLSFWTDIKLIKFHSVLQYFKSVSPKISRIGPQKRNNGFFIIWLIWSVNGSASEG